MLTLGLLLATSVPSAGALSTFERVADGVYVVRDDSGQWAGNMSLDITHQVNPEYQAKKVLDLSSVPEDVWAATREVRLAVHLALRDYSWHDAPQEDGLDESFEVVVNGTVHAYPTNCGAPAWAGGRVPAFGWHDIVLPKGEFTRGANEIILRKAPGDKHDDYLYLCIDLTVPPANSYVAFSNNEWTQHALTIPGGNGEYMVRLYLIAKDLALTTVWTPGAQPELGDPAGIILYRGGRGLTPTADGLKLQAGQAARLEWHPAALDGTAPMSALVEATGDVECAWLDAEGKPGQGVRGPGSYFADLPADRTLKPSGLTIKPADQPVTVKRVTLRGTQAFRPLPKAVNMAPHIGPPAGKAARRAPSCKGAAGTVDLANGTLRARFSTANGHLRLTSLYNELAACEVLRHPESVALFLVEVDGKRYSGTRDFVLEGLELNMAGLVATLRLAEPTLRATLRADIGRESLLLRLNLTNAGAAPVDLKLAFPHLAGLGLADKPEPDYYFFPWGGGIFSDRPAIIRRGYGDHEALYQVMDLFSPERGAGLAVRADDAEGWHKVLALRKHVPGQAEFGGQVLGMPVAKQYQWDNPFEAVEGISLAYEYLRRTRAPGEAFEPAPAVLWAHEGDWRRPMADYAAWAHRVWKFRPYPSRLEPAVHMIATGWGQDILFRDGAYRTDFVRPNTDCIELMSWWDWSPLGPWGIPIDQIKEKMGEGAWKLWEPYLVKDPVTGQMMWNNQPGDYDGYNERFGGLPAFREAVQKCKDLGALTTLYTDPFRMDSGSKVGQAHGEEWGVVQEDGELSKGYDVYNPCHDDVDVREWVADAMERVIRETGADGIRLDEYGHRGFSCYSTRHRHSFAEPGLTQWQKATAEATRMVRERMDRVDPTTVLTTEHPGHDYLMQFIDGCITYDLTVQKTELRPLEVNLQRFYFPECKAYELDHQGADREHRRRFFNGVASFGAYYPDRMYQILREYREVFASRDCEALVPTLVEGVYANRFTAEDTTIYTLFNATGHTVHGPVLQVPRNVEVRDLLGPGECEVDGEERVWLYLERDAVACLGVTAP